MAANGGLNETELAMLSTMAYLLQKVKIKSKNPTVEDYIDAAQALLNKNIDIGCLDKEQWEELFTRAKKHKNLMSYQIVDVNYPDGNTEFAAFTIKKGNDVTIVYRGTAGSYGWSDNGYAMYSEDSEQQRQAREYARKILKRYGNGCYYTTTGHSKGGNLAQFAALELPRINACFGFDSQGFSYEYYQKLKEKYSDAELEKLFSRITIIAAGYIENGVVKQGDIVNELGNYTSGNRYYVNVGDLGINPFDFHYPNYLVIALDDGAETSTFFVGGCVVNQLTKILSEKAEGKDGFIYECATDLLMTFVAAYRSGLTADSIRQAIVDTCQMKTTELLHKYPIIGELSTAAIIICEKIVSKGKEVVTAVVTMAVTATKVVEAAIKHGIEVAKTTIETSIQIVKETAAKMAAKVGGWVVGVTSKVVKVLESWKNSITNMIKKVVVTGAQYAAANPLFVIDTDLLYQHAAKITDINRLLSQIDRDMNSLYSKVGAIDMLRLIHADLHTHQSSKLKKCRNYMEDTAYQFEQIESFLALIG